MPFGLCNALATFTRMLNEVFRPIYARYPGLFRHYMDNVIIMTPLDQKDLHTEICHMFFDILEKNSLYLNQQNASSSNRSGLPRDSRLKWGIDDRPSKDRWHQKLAHHAQKCQGSAQHFRTPWLPPSLDPQLLEDCQHQG